MYDVITFGSATIDTFVDTFDRKHLKNSQKRYKHTITYPVGDKILINELHTTIGGGGTNTALTFARFGHKTAYCGCIGNDPNAELVKAFLKDENIEFLGHTANDKTAYSIILDSIEHDRTILTYKGASDKLDYNKLNIKEISKAKVFYFSSLLHKSYETQKKLIKLAKKNNILVVFNPSSYQAVQGYKKLKDVLQDTNCLILNKEEAQDLLGNTTPKCNQLLLDLKKYLAEKATTIITDAGNGSYAYDGKNAIKAIPNPKKIAETTGAGDAFASAYISAILKGHDMEHSLKLATANAQSVITNKGAKEIILTYNQASKYANKEKYKTEKIEF